MFRLETQNNALVPRNEELEAKIEDLEIELETFRGLVNEDEFAKNPALV